MAKRLCYLPLLVGLAIGCTREDHTVEITALREGVAEAQSLVDEYKARVADLRASTTTGVPVPVVSPTEAPEAQACLFPGRTDFDRGDLNKFRI